MSALRRQFCGVGQPLVGVAHVEAQVGLEGRAAGRARVKREVVKAALADAQVAARQQDRVLGSLD